MRDREIALHKLESDISDIKTIFENLNELIHEQGNDIQKIDDNTIKVENIVEIARLDLSQNKKDKARKFSIFLYKI